MNYKEVFPLDNYIIERSMTFIQESLSKLHVSKREKIKTELLCEETIAQLIANAPADSTLQVQIKKGLGQTSVNLKMNGEEFDISSDASLLGIDPDETESTDAIRSIVVMSFGDNYKQTHEKGQNKVRIVVDGAKQSLYFTLFALVLGVAFGLVLKYLIPEMASDVICNYLLVPFKTVFMNALKMIIAPVVFLSIITSFSQYGSISEFGKLGAKVMGFYFFTTICAVLLGYAVFHVIQPGEFGFALGGNIESFEIALDADTSVLNTLINIVPSNFLSPFLESDTLQLMFLAAICGVALGMIGEHATILRDIFVSLNSLFLTITRLITKAMPLAVFCSMSILVRTVNTSTFGHLVSGVGTQLITVVLMMTTYGLIILLVARLNPLTFFKKIKEGMLTSFTLSSSSAAMPTNMKICTDKLGISPKVCNFSIPLGATVNMDGTCIFLTVMGLFLARAYGIDVTASQLLPLAFTIILLSLGAPGIPGIGIICMGIVLNVLNVPLDAISLIIGINPLIDMVDTANNTTGDMAISLVVAKLEKLLNVEKFNS